MKTHLRKLNLLMRIFDAEDFYTIRISGNILFFQGVYSAELAEKYEKICKISFEKNDIGHWNIVKNNINITLT